MRIPLGIIPAGSGNALAKGSVGVLDPLTSTFCVLKGMARPFDIGTILQGERRLFFFLALSWGIIADVDFDSEKLRWLGSFRFTFTALSKMVSLKMYRGKIEFIPDESWEAKESNLCGVTCERCCESGLNEFIRLRKNGKLEGTRKASEESEAAKRIFSLDDSSEKEEEKSEKTVKRFPGRVSGDKQEQEKLEKQKFDEKINQGRKIGQSGSKGEYKNQGKIPKEASATQIYGPPLKYIGDNPQEKGEKWVTLEGEDFVSVSVGNFCYLNHDMMATPYAHWSDGKLDLTMIRNVSSMEMVSLASLVSFFPNFTP